MSENFSNWNWVVLVLYLGGVFAIGIKARKHQKSSEDFFLAGRSMGYLPLGLSMCMTLFSAISYQAIPNQSYYFGMLMMMSMLMIWVDLPVISLIVLPIFYRLKLYSIYEYLEKRFGLAMRIAASIIFLFWRLFWLATVIYAPCKALQVVLEIATGTIIPIQGLVITVGIVTTIYTFLGGMRAVIWTDVAQFCVMAGSVVAIIGVVWSSMNYGPGEVWQVAREGGRTVWAHTRFDLQDPWCLWGLVPFYFLARLSFYSADQINVQRALAARSLREAQKAFALNCLCLTLFIPILCYVGLNLYAFYQTHPERIPQQYQKVELAPGEDAWGVEKAETGERLEDKILATFVARELPVGIAGLVISALFAACMSTMDSGLNSVATSLIVDFHRRLGAGKKWLARRVGKSISDLDEADELKLARPVVIFLGAIATAGGCIVGQLGTIFEIARSALDTPGIPLACVFLLGMMTRRANMTGAFVGLAVGMLTMLWFIFGPRLADAGVGWIWPWLDVDGEAWRVSAIYPGIVGAILTLGVGYLVSLLAGRKTTPDQLRGLTMRGASGSI